MAILQCNYELEMDLNVCRICVSQTNTGVRMFNIFSKVIVDGFLVTLPEIILYCVDLKIVERNGIPCKICQTCKSTLLKFYTFKQRCKRTEKLLQQTVDSSDMPNSVAINYPESQYDGAHVEMPDKLDEGGIEFLEEANFAPSRVSNESNSETNQQQLSIKIYERSESHITLYSKNPNETETLTLSVTKNEEDKPEFCTEGSLVSGLESLPAQLRRNEAVEGVQTLSSEIIGLNNHFSTKAHLKAVSSNNNKKLSSNVMICTICGKTIAGQTCFSRHMKLHEANANVTEFFIYHTCEICKTVFLKLDQLSDHVRLNEHPVLEKIDHEEKPYICGVCSVHHYRLDHIKQHILSHLKHFSCPFEGCGCVYASSARLANHISSKHIEYESYKCCHCGSDEFESMSELQQHLRKKCTKKKFNCHHCDKKFLTSRSLAQHLKCLEKRYCCSECGKCFAQPGELTLHLRVHNGERPFQCTVCGKSYRTASFRTAHMDSHIDGKTFECHLCGKKLQSRTCYRNHVRRHSEEKKHACDVCDKKFYTKYNVKVHKAKVHKLNDSTKP